MTSDINNALETLRDKLQKIGPAIEHIDSAKKVVESFNVYLEEFIFIIKDLKSKLEIENRYYIENIKRESTDLISEMQKNVDDLKYMVNSITNLESDAKQIRALSEDLLNEIKNTHQGLETKIDHTANESKQQASLQIRALSEDLLNEMKSTHKILDTKIDDTVNKIKQEASLQIRALSEDLLNEMKNTHKSLDTKIDHTVNEFKQEASLQAKILRNRTIILIISLILSGITSITAILFCIRLFGL
ncbi:MAG: hypothetical protein WCY48_06925 [Candidatus Caldatribacteriota bacterium]